MSNPVRIYVVHHPDNPAGEELCRRIYDWFRLPTMEGVPVYVRSKPRIEGKGNGANEEWHEAHLPALPYNLALGSNGTPKCLEYIVALVDAHMVRDMAWRAYLLGLLQPGRSTEVFPVAMDGTAFNLPREFTSRNFIRHRASGSDPADAEDAIQETLKFLTEALARHLRAEVFKDETGGKLPIFISYARADGTEIPKKLRAYIDGQTQCAAFLDENDIAFGADFSRVLGKNVHGASALIVVRGDHYADRPWCRWELDSFNQPQILRVTVPSKCDVTVRAFRPGLVVETTVGVKVTRSLPELATLPTTRWADGLERACVSLLLREVFFAARNVLAAGRASPVRAGEGKEPPLKTIHVNRLPGPLGLQKLLRDVRSERAGAKANGPEDPVTATSENAQYLQKDGCELRICYPGNGLPLIELSLLKKSFKEIDLLASSDLELKIPPELRDPRLFRRCELWLSAGDSEDLAARGYLAEHLRELLVYLLRPLVRAGCDIIYGGRPPTRDYDPGGWRNNHTLAILEVLKDERNFDIQDTDSTDCRGRLFNLLPWPQCRGVEPRDEASWIDVCTVVPFDLADEFSELRQFTLADAGGARFRYLAAKALTLTHARGRIAKGFPCATPEELRRWVSPKAYVCLGGKVEGFSGIMPGIFEEFVEAMQAECAIYVIGGLGGASGVLARALLDRSGERPPEMRAEHYLRLPVCGPDRIQMLRALRRIGDLQPRLRLDVDQAFERLWNCILEVRNSRYTRLNNGLNFEDNVALLKKVATSSPVELVWRGLAARVKAGKLGRESTIGGSASS